jgi:PKD repeat protein
LLVLWTLLAGSTAGCPTGTSAGADAATDGPAGDVPPPLTLHIAITGCAAYEPATARCSGPAPLSLSFSPVGSPQFTRFTWTFGDGTPVATDRAPLHTYLLPGSHEVDLVGAFGSANTVQSKAVVVVEPRAAGQPCDLDLQCASGLRCTCAPGTGCSPAFLRGLCSTPCDSVACDAGAVCAALALAPPADGGGTALLPWCVAGCQTSADCVPGFRCETLAGAGVAGPGTWTRGCLPIGAVGDIGATCRDATGELADATCATGSCIDLGALGTCSATCDGDRPCPDKTACALMPDGRRLCLVDCTAPGASCALDPLLGCVAPTSGDAGATGFRTDGGAASYCAPLPCAYDTDCAPAGRCGPGAQCVL